MSVVERMRTLSAPLSLRLLSIIVSCVALLILLHMRFFVFPQLAEPLPIAEHEQLCAQMQFEASQSLLVNALYKETKSLHSGLLALLHPLIVLISLILVLQILSFRPNKPH
jgi:ABC-type transport system involved in cytochrome bd biosynthesis fused ATPase/permease subunit